MNDLDINKMWNDFLSKFPYTEAQFDSVIYQCKRCFIDPIIFHSNLFLLSSNRKFYPETGVLEPTDSVRELMLYLPPAYPLTYASAFPDVIVWYQNIFYDDSFNTNPYINELRSNPSRYIDKETDKPNSNFLQIILYGYGKDNLFESRIKIEPLITPSKQEIQSALDAISNTDPLFRRSLS